MTKKEKAAKIKSLRSIYDYYYNEPEIQRDIRVEIQKLSR